MEETNSEMSVIWCMSIRLGAEPECLPCGLTRRTGVTGIVVCERYEVRRQNGKETEVFWNVPECILQASSVPVTCMVNSASLFCS